MTTSSIPLAKGLDLSKMEWPAFLSIKHDGVPVKLTVTKLDGAYNWEVVSRSGKPVPSVHTYCEEIAYTLGSIPAVEDGTYTIVAEITHRWETNFKDVSGIVRKKEPQPFLIWNVFDFSIDYATPQPFSIRTGQAFSLIDELRLPYVQYVAQKALHSLQEAEAVIAFMQKTLPDVEGFIVVSASRLFKPNTRHWDYQKIVVDPHYDLTLHSFEEAVSADGEPLGMVGRINVWYKDQVTGVGPGKMTHSERIELWDMNGPLRQDHKNRILTVKAKRDPSYEMMRQPTFQHWREDKDEPNELG